MNCHQFLPSVCKMSQINFGSTLKSSRYKCNLPHQNFLTRNVHKVSFKSNYWGIAQKVAFYYSAKMAQQNRIENKEYNKKQLFENIIKFKNNLF